MRWQELHVVAYEVEGDPAAMPAQKRAVRREADEFYARHEAEFGLLASLDTADEVNDYDWGQRVLE